MQSLLMLYSVITLCVEDLFVVGGEETRKRHVFHVFQRKKSSFDQVLTGNDIDNTPFLQNRKEKHIFERTF